MKQKIIFIGGMPGTGKTTLAYKLAIFYGIDKVVSLDLLKTVWLQQYSCKEYPYLYTTTHEAYKLEALSPIDGYIKHCEQITELLIPVINGLSNEKILIVEGAQILPSVIKYFFAECCYINLYANEKEELISRYEMKSRIRDYPWIKNIDSIMEINNFIKQLDEPFLSQVHLNTDFHLILEIIKENFNEHFLY